MITKLPVNEFLEKFSEIPSLFVAMASFESRCTTIAKSFAGKFERAVVLKNSQVGVLADDNFEKLIELGGENCIHYELTLDDPIKSASVLSLIPSLVSRNSIGPVFVDITTFTHEQLLILIKVLKNAKLTQRIVFGYSGALQYSVNTLPEDVWLSKGVGQVRSVLGFPGRFLPSRKLHLIVLVGFEYERAKAIIEQFEPSALTLGVGKKSESVSEEHFQSNRRFFEDVQNFVAMRKSICSDIDTFEFSCVDPESVESQVMSVINAKSGFNTVVCPLNTKLSTVGVALAAAQNEDIQLCYARAIEYNEQGYSTPSDKITMYETIFS
jgi:hypothetical protein